jgi:hypothetical protein
MKRAAVGLLVISVAAPVMAAFPLAQMLRYQLRIQERLLEETLVELQDQQQRVESAWVRVERESSDLLRAQEQGESLESLRLRDQDLRQAEAELLMHVQEAQRLRREVISSRVQMDETQAELERLAAQVGSGDDPLSGTWRMVMEPGGLEGYAGLELDGTLVQGSYQLSGGWSGSLRGTLVARKVRLERVDSQLGFAAVMYGKLVGSGSDATLEGRWEATQLATGMPSGGSWRAERVEELPE